MAVSLRNSKENNDESKEEEEEKNKQKILKILTVECYVIV